MKFFIANLAVRTDSYSGTTSVSICASSEQSARKLLSEHARPLSQGELLAKTHAEVRLHGPSGVFTVESVDVHEVSASTFEQMSQILPSLAELDVHGLTSESEPHERARALARRLCDALAKRKVKVSYGALLHAVAFSMGWKDWFVLEAQPRAQFRQAKQKAEVRDAQAVPWLVRMHTVWLAEGDAALAASLLNTTEDSLLGSFDAGAADSAFCGRPSNWRPEHSITADTEVMDFEHRFEVSVEQVGASHRVTGRVDGRDVITMTNSCGTWWVSSSTCLPSQDLYSARAMLACYREVMRSAMALRDEELKAHPPTLEVIEVSTD